jgi:hypothetical protein
MPLGINITCRNYFNSYAIHNRVVFNEIHRSNMSKLDTNGKPIMWKNGVLDMSRAIGKC